MAIGQRFRSKAFFQSIVLTISFSICLCLMGPVGTGPDDPLSAWLIEQSAGGVVNLKARNGSTPDQIDLRPASMIYPLFEWAISMIAGLLSVFLFTGFPLRWCWTAFGTLMAMILGMPIFFWHIFNVTIGSSVPLLCGGFGLWTAYVLHQPAIFSARSFFPSHETDAIDTVGVKPRPASSRPVEPISPGAGFADPPFNGVDSPLIARNDNAVTTALTIGRYEIIRSIGRGAMGEVFLGRDPHINRLTAVKTVRFEERFADDDIEQIKGKFFREAESAGTLSHPHIVTIYDAGEDGDCAYIAMEFLEGSTLLRFARRKRLLPLRRLIRYMVQVADALDYAHSQGVTHRDIKPANIMLMHSGQIKITDFGIAHLATSSQTQTGVVKGTPYYMSPEQFSGQKVDGRSDIFSLGTTMFQLLTGTLPFYAESPALLMNQIMNFPHPNPRAINPRVIPAVVAIVDKALEKDRDNRYQTAKDLARDLCRLDKRIMAVLRKDRARSAPGK
jgi:tRNA A-37 threonylcarbamoyl transferase component Bud32